MEAFPFIFIWAHRIMASASSAVDIGFVPQGHHSKEKAEEWATKSHTHTQRKEHIFDKNIQKSIMSHRKAVKKRQMVNNMKTSTCPDSEIIQNK